MTNVTRSVARATERSPGRVLASAARVLGLGVLWLTLLNATLCTVAPVIMVMMAIERIGAGLTALEHNKVDIAIIPEMEAVPKRMHNSFVENGVLKPSHVRFSIA